jgi:hypothetical protein
MSAAELRQFFGLAGGSKGTCQYLQFTDLGETGNPWCVWISVLKGISQREIHTYPNISLLCPMSSAQPVHYYD